VQVSIQRPTNADLLIIAILVIFVVIPTTLAYADDNLLWLSVAGIIGFLLAFQLFNSTGDIATTIAAVAVALVLMTIPFADLFETRRST